MAARRHAVWMVVWLPLLLGAAAPSAEPGHGSSWRDCPGFDQPRAPAPVGLAACVAASGPRASGSIRVRLGDSIETMKAAASLKLDFTLGTFVTDTPVDIVWTTNGRQFVFQDVGGTGESVLKLDVTPGGRSLAAISFGWQNRPLDLSEAMAKAKRLQSWLVQAGYRPATTNDAGWSAPFGVVVDRSKPPISRADSWDAAEKLLASDSDNVEEMALYTLTSADTQVRVSLQNMRRAAWNFQDHVGNRPIPGFRRSIFDGDGGYEWLLTVDIGRPR